MRDDPARLTHLDETGRPRMVDVSGKEETRRSARAVGRIRMARETYRILEEGSAAKGNVLQVAELAGIQAAKRTGELIPLCHLLPGVSTEVALELDPDLPGVRAQAKARIRGSTGVEMEALTAVSAALLTVYDMLKSYDRSMDMGAIRLTEKSGGRSGAWTAPGGAADAAGSAGEESPDEEEP